jgi:glycosyltransferase involved in cell wall biosynthesis
MYSKDDVTVIVAHYNIPPNLFKKCIDSIEKQGLNYWIVDDCSLPKYMNSLDRFKGVWFLPKNLGPYGAFEFLLDKVETPYVMRVDADDYITGFPDIKDGHDAYVNNVNNKVSIDPVEFRKRPYAGLNGIVVKTDVLKSVWMTKWKYLCDIVIFHRLLLKHDCVMNETSLYVYQSGRKDSITQQHIIKSNIKPLMRIRKDFMEDEAITLKW